MKTLGFFVVFSILGGLAWSQTDTTTTTLAPSIKLTVQEAKDECKKQNHEGKDLLDCIKAKVK
ncbi:MAG: hypothetical protein LW875_02980 [Proteobacteria bacterium]|jgi:hypothetical protein|nr:hypothetical protein [Pseudomonadota bacterium]